jgi:signal transduction histidine kinase
LPSEFTTLVAGLGHDLRGPLNVIVGASELLLEEMADGAGRAAWRDDLRGIHASGKKLCEIVDALVDLARIESGQAPIAAAPAALRDVVEEAAADHRARGARLEIVQTGEALAVPVDARRLRRCLASVLDAVIERAGAASVTISVAESSISVGVGTSAQEHLALDARIAIAALVCARMNVDVARRGAALVLTVGGAAVSAEKRSSR